MVVRRDALTEQAVANGRTEAQPPSLASTSSSPLTVGCAVQGAVTGSALARSSPQPRRRHRRDRIDLLPLRGVPLPRRCADARRPAVCEPGTAGSFPCGEPPIVATAKGINGSAFRRRHACGRATLRQVNGQRYTVLVVGSVAVDRKISYVHRSVSRPRMALPLPQTLARAPRER
jgi:hypothetical protein